MTYSVYSIAETIERGIENNPNQPAIIEIDAEKQMAFEVLLPVNEDNPSDLSCPPYITITNLVSQQSYQVANNEGNTIWGLSLAAAEKIWELAGEPEKKTYNFAIALDISLEVEEYSREKAVEKVLSMSGGALKAHTTKIWGLTGDYAKKDILMYQCCELD